MRTYSLKILIVTMLMLALFAMGSCSAPSGNTDEGEKTPDNGGGEKIPTVELKIPSSDDYGRNTVHFDTLNYKRPNVDAMLRDFAEVTKAINDCVGTFAEQLELVVGLEEHYSQFHTLHAYISAKYHANVENSKYNKEYVFLTSKHSAFVKAMDDLAAACADSPHAVRFEQEYFGDGLIKEYSEGGRYTDIAVSLMENEAKLSIRFSSLGPATVHITCDGIYGSYEAVLKALKSKYADQPEQLEVFEKSAEELYLKQRSTLCKDLLVSLMKVRSLLATEAGYSNYVEYSYATGNSDFTSAQYEHFVNDILDYVTPVYRKLSIQVFNDYFRVNSPEVISRNEALNMLGEVYAQMDGELSDVYDYMLHFGMFDIQPSEYARTDGAFTVYLEQYKSPFIFATVNEDVTDFLMLAHEFGHYVDLFRNGNDGAPSELVEISSQGLELLTLLGLRSFVGEDNYKYLLYTKMRDMLSNLILQAVYAEFEHRAYRLSYGEITAEALEDIMEDIASDVDIDLSKLLNFNSLIASQIYTDPFFVQSHTVSTAVALDMFLSSDDVDTDIYGIFDSLTNRNGMTGFSQNLYSSGLESPFNEDKIKSLADGVHFLILGSHYYSSHGGGSNAT